MAGWPIAERTMRDHVVPFGGGFVMLCNTGGTIKSSLWETFGENVKNVATRMMTFWGVKMLRRCFPFLLFSKSENPRRVMRIILKIK